MFADTLNEEQAAALGMIRDNRVSVLCGAPGVGKTYTCRAVLEWASSAGLSVALAAPTGKAAKRMEELTEYPASTIHRLLGPTKDRDGFKFEAGPESPLPYDLLILDETSMVDTWLMHSVMAAVDPDRTRVLLVGDPDQLPSIGPGTVLQDIISSGVVSVTRLTHIQRNAGDIVRACHAIKAGQGYEPSTTLDLDAGHNLRHVEASEDAIPGIIEALAAERLPARGYDPLWGIQVISPTNEKGLFSCGALNRVLRERLNQKTGWTTPEDPDEKPAANGNAFRPGDKIIQTKNEI
ncbi:MAG: AAA family ATPase, partial [Pseudomonadota bacterium]